MENLDEKWLFDFGQSLYEIAVSCWKGDLAHQMFDLPVPWQDIRKGLEAVHERQAWISKQIVERTAKEGENFGGKGLLQLLHPGAADYVIAIKFRQQKKEIP